MTRPLILLCLVPLMAAANPAAAQLSEQGLRIVPSMRLQGAPAGKQGMAPTSAGVLRKAYPQYKVPAGAVDLLEFGISVRGVETDLQYVWLMADGSVRNLDGAAEVRWNGRFPPDARVFVRHRNHLGATVLAGRVPLHGRVAFGELAAGNVEQSRQAGLRDAIDARDLAAVRKAALQKQRGFVPQDLNFDSRVDDADINLAARNSLQLLSLYQPK